MNAYIKVDNKTKFIIFSNPNDTFSINPDLCNNYDEVVLIICYL